MAKTGLLVLTNPVQIGKILPLIKKQVKNTLYIHLTNTLNEPLGRYKPEIFNYGPKYSCTVKSIYSETVEFCENLDVRVLLSNLKCSVKNLHTTRSIDLVIFDKLFEQSLIDKFLTAVINKQSNCSILTVENNDTSNYRDSVSQCSDKLYKHVVLGGTFDRLHTGHKVLLSKAILHATEKLTVGVTDISILKGKILWELIEPVDTRINELKKYLNDICPCLQYDIVPISDPFGPTKSDPTMNLIVVSAETLRGGEKVNELRRANNLSPLDIIVEPLIETANKQLEEDAKISSSNSRMKLLGTLLKQPNEITNSGPYIIGLTGGIAAGKTSVSQRLAKLGGAVIDCDKIAHGVYEIGKPCHKKLVDTWGKKILNNQGQIDRKVLGGIVFGNPEELQRLNSIVWPEIAKEVETRIKELQKDGIKVVIIEAAVLVTAGWDKMCHEVWACIIPPEEAIIRLGNRNNMNATDAQKRLDVQPTNTFHVEHAHVVLSTYWSPEYTQCVVERAWTSLQKRLSNERN